MIQQKALKPRKCKHCREPYTPSKPMQTACSIPCALALAQKAKEKAQAVKVKEERKADRERKEKLKTLADYKREAQSAVNAFVRQRDLGKPCISCGRHHKGEIHAGHYLSRGAHPELALDPRNIHSQCAPCNTYLSGNQINYRKGLIAREGIELVEWLEGPHEPKKWTREELTEIRDHYRKALRELKKAPLDQKIG